MPSWSALFDHLVAEDVVEGNPECRKHELRADLEGHEVAPVPAPGGAPDSVAAVPVGLDAVDGS
jgi:hypothetical protein